MTASGKACGDLGIWDGLVLLADTWPRRRLPANRAAALLSLIFRPLTSQLLTR